MNLPVNPSRAPAHFRMRRSKTQRLLLALAFGLWLVLLAVAGEWAARREIAALVDAVHRSLEVQALTLRGTVARYKHIPFTSGQQRDISGLLTLAGKTMPESWSAWFRVIHPAPIPGWIMRQFFPFPIVKLSPLVRLRICM